MSVYGNISTNKWAEGFSPALTCPSVCVFRVGTWSRRLRATVAWTTRCWLVRLPASSPCLRASCCANGPTSPDSTKSRSVPRSVSSCLFLSLSDTLTCRDFDLTWMFYFLLSHACPHMHRVFLTERQCNVMSRCLCYLSFSLHYCQ